MLSTLVLLVALPVLVPGSTSIWRDGVTEWAGNRMCLELKMIPAPTSPAAEGGVKTPLHCPLAGPNNSGCIEWLGAAPSVGACDPNPASAGTRPAQPNTLEIK